MKVPSYRKHASGQAVVTLHGRDHYLGVYDSPESRERYRQLIATYVRNKGAAGEPGAASLFLWQAIDRFWFEAVPRMSYQDRDHYKQLFLDPSKIFGDTLLADFGPVRFKAVRKAYVARGWCRRHCNAQASRFVRFLAWCVGEELYPAEKLNAIKAVPGLRRDEAPDNPDVQPVADHIIGATMPHLPPYARALVELLRWSGCRPSEAVMMKPEDVDTDGVAELPGGRRIVLPGVWVYARPEHKTVRFDIDRWVVIGPRAQAAVGPLLRFTLSGQYVFAPRQTSAGVASDAHYRSRSLHRAIARACQKAGVPHWFPYQLRHTRACEIKQKLGEEAAKDTLGHKTPNTTAIYAERSLERAAEAQRQTG